MTPRKIRYAKIGKRYMALRWNHVVPNADAFTGHAFVRMVRYLQGLRWE